MSQNKYLKFFLDDTCFSIKIEQVEEILHLPQITKVPLSEDFVIGISNLRGVIVPIIDLKKRIKGDFINVSELSRIIVTNIEGEKTGLLIESISAIEEVEEEKITSSEKFEGISSKYLEGIYESTSGKLVGIVNLKEVLSFDLRKSRELGSERRVSEELGEKEEAMVEKYGKKILTFRVGFQLFAIDIEFSREIIEKPSIEAIPSKSKDIIGVFNLRDEIIPVLDLKRKLEIEEVANYGEEHIDKIIIFTYYGNIIGLLVDEVEEVVDPLKSEILAVPNTFDEASKKYVKAIYNSEEGKEIIFILDEKSLLSEEEIEDISSVRGELDENSVLMEREEKKIAVFKLSDEEFGISIESINEINRLPQITPVPKSSSFIEGIINLRGEIIPVINLRERLGFERKEFDEFERVIIVEIDGQKTGFIVDRVTEIKSIDKDNFKEVPKFLKTTVEREVIESIVNIEKESRIITIIAVNNILTKEEKKEIKLKNIKKGVIKEENLKVKEESVKKGGEKTLEKNIRKKKSKERKNKQKEVKKTGKRTKKKKLIKAK